MSDAAASWKAAPASMQFPSDRIDVWRVCLDTSHPLESGFSGVLSPDEAARASRFHFENDRKRFLRCRIALRTLLGSYLDIPPAVIRFRYGKNGKPEIAGLPESSGLRFNLSNSRGLALIAISSGRALGVDVEKVRPKAENLDIARRFFSTRETEALMALGEDKRQEAFFACWTRKEAFLKSTGDGLACPLSNFSVSVDPDGPAALWEIRGDATGVTDWSMESVRPGAGYMGALAYKGPACRVEWLCRGDCALPTHIV